MKHYQGSCHCGAVTFKFSAPPINEAMRCDCSICRRKAMIMTKDVIMPGSMEISDEKGALSTYQFGTNTARHHFCSRCGIHTFVETRLDPGHYRINLGCVEGIDAFDLPDVVYDGKSL